MQEQIREMDAKDLLHELMKADGRMDGMGYDGME